MGQAWKIASLKQLEAFNEHNKKLLEKHKIITYDEPVYGAVRSLDQNALFHMWMRQVTAQMLGKKVSDIDEGELEGTKRRFKLWFYKEAGQHWIVHTVLDSFTGESKKDVRSTSRFTKGQMFMFMEFVQDKAAEYSIMLESKGEYASLQMRAAS